ncbi:MAG: site-specific DNA-methyltransferase [Herpetosiphonaceae bacterium]|nr:site-specific DNA-methyltransferase [Herpetosiphonaceae bacterium]
MVQYHTVHYVPASHPLILPQNLTPAGIPEDELILSSTVVTGAALEVLQNIPAGLAQVVVTSPPYWSLRDYDIPGQIGLEDDPDAYIESLVKVFAEVQRVLADDGTLWLNIGDSYTSGGRTWRAPDKKNPARAMATRPPTPPGLKSKDLVGIPWKLAFALQKAGWYLRSDIVWRKPNTTPESVKDRPTRSHEYLFLLTKSERYFYDHRAVREANDRQVRSVWDINTEGLRDVHFATFPTKLVEPCILLGSQRGDVVLDPFFGSGTVGVVAIETGRAFLGIELNPTYVEIAKRRLDTMGGRFDRRVEQIESIAV